MHLTVDEMALIELALNGVLVPLVSAVAVFLWRLDRRMYRVEWHLGIDPDVAPGLRRFSFRRR